MSQAAGNFNRRITIQKRTDEMSQFGQMKDKWVDVHKNIWAYVLAQPGTATGRSQPTDGVTRAISRYSFRIRWRKNVDAGMRVVYQGNYFDITEVIEDIRGHEYIDIAANYGGSVG